MRPLVLYTILLWRTDTEGHDREKGQHETNFFDRTNQGSAFEYM